MVAVRKHPAGFAVGDSEPGRVLFQSPAHGQAATRS
jgi:hypothetical protein